jgi:hypothetical protein
LANEPSFNQKAAAEALFREGADAYAAEDFEKACAKFEASNDLDPALGTTLRLADCYDRQGKTASAWATFHAAVALAQSQDQPERENIALERAQDLEARLSHVKISVAPSTRALAGLTISINGAAVPSGMWDSPIPVDPGEQRIEARAVGYESWTQRLEVTAERKTLDVQIPALRAERGAAKPPAVAGANVAAEPLQPPQQEQPSSTQRTLGYISGGVGLAALGVGGFFAYRAYDLNSQSLEHCLEQESTACTPQGKSLRDDARRRGTYATVASAGGAVLLGTALVLILTSPDRPDEEGNLEVTTRAGLDGAGVELWGRW